MKRALTNDQGRLGHDDGGGARRQVLGREARGGRAHVVQRGHRAADHDEEAGPRQGLHDAAALF